MTHPKHPLRTYVTSAVLLGALALSACTDDAGEAGESASTTRPDGENTEALHAFLEKAVSGKKAVFAADYSVELPGTAISQGRLRLAQDGERLMSELSGDTTDPAVGFYDSGAGTVACAATHGEADWECYRTTGDATTAPLVIDLEDLFRIQDQLRPAQYWYSFTSSEEEVAGTPATCLTAAALPEIPADVKQRIGETARLCVSDSGVPLVVDVKGGETSILVTATGYRAEVQDSDFDPPAPVQEGPPNVLVPAPPEEVPQGQSVE
jgi:hypothetical protein